MPERYLEETRHTDPAAALRKAFRELAKGLHTAMPAEIVTYDPARRRAQVRQMLRIALRDGSTERRADLYDVPVLQPWGGGMGLHMPLSAGDPVLLVFCMRGASRYKSSLSLSTPDIGALMSMADAFAIPAGIKPASLPAAEDGWLCIQSEDGSTNVRIHATSGVVAEHGSRSVTISDSEIVADGDLRVTGRLTVEGSSVEHDGVEIGKEHDHKILKAKISQIAMPQLSPQPIETETESVEDSA